MWQQYLRPALWKQWSPQISGVRIAIEDQLCTPTRELVIAACMKGTVLGPLCSRVRFVIDEVQDTDDASRAMKIEKITFTAGGSSIAACGGRCQTSRAARTQCGRLR